MSRHLRQFVIHLLFEVVHLGRPDMEAIPQLDDVACASADQASLRAIELVKVIPHAGEGHKAAHAEIRDIDKEAEVADVGDEGREGLG